MSCKMCYIRGFFVVMTIFVLSFHHAIGANSISSEKNTIGNNVLRQSKKLNGQLIEIQITKKKFDQKAHTIEGKEYSLIIDGKKPIGTPVTPVWEISNFTIKWDGKLIELPKELYQDCYEPNLGGVTILPSYDGKSILLQMSGSDGAFAYDVYWVVERARIYNRYIWNQEN